MSDSDWMTALETAEYIRMHFRKGSTPKNRMTAFRVFLKSPRAYGFPEPSLRMGPKRLLWYRPHVDKWMADDKANKEAKAKWRENPTPLTGAVKNNLYRDDEDEGQQVEEPEPEDSTPPPRPKRERLND